MPGSVNTEKTVPFALLAMTVVTGLVDATSFLGLGRVFTANMTGNIVLLGFAVARVPGLSIERSMTALVAFSIGAILGGRIMSKVKTDSQIRFAAAAFGVEVAFLLISALCGIGYRSDLVELRLQTFALIAATALAMGTRNAVVRKLAIPDLTTTVLTLTVTGLAADSSFAGGDNPRLWRRLASVAAMFVGAATGAVMIRYSLSATMAVAAVISAVSSIGLYALVPSPRSEQTAQQVHGIKGEK